MKNRLTWQILAGNNKSSIGANSGIATYKYKLDSGKTKKVRVAIDVGAMISKNLAAEDNKLGNCDTVIPDLHRFLKSVDDKSHKPEKELDAILLTHSHIDHIGAIPYLMLMGYKMPKIYATPFTAKRLEQALSNNEIPADEWPEITKIAPGSKLREGRMKISVFSVSHSTPQSVGFYISTPDGTILHPGDFKLDDSLVWGPGFNEDNFLDTVKDGVDLLLLDSTGANKDEINIKESDVRDNLEILMKKYPDKRFVIATMSGFEENLASVAKVSAENKRILWIAGWSHEQALSALSETGLSLSDHIGVNVDVRVVRNKKIDELKATDPKESVVIVTGSVGHQNAVLGMASEGKSKQLTLDKDKDIILFCAPSLPGHEKNRAILLDRLKKAGHTVYTNKDMNLYSPAHARMPELIEMAVKSKAKTIAPIHGSASLREENKAALDKVGFKTISIENGEVIDVKKDGCKILDNKKEIPYLLGIETRTSDKNWRLRDYIITRSPSRNSFNKNSAKSPKPDDSNKGKDRPKPRVFFDLG